MNIQTALTRLEVFESEIGRLYKWLAEIHAHDREAAIVFFRMHLEEKAHASLVRFQKRIVKQNPKSFKDVELDLEILERTSAAVRAMHEAPQAPDLRTAVRRAFEIESTAAEAHYRTALAPSCEGMLHLLTGLGAGDQQHAAALLELGAHRGYLPPRAPAGGASVRPDGPGPGGVPFRPPGSFRRPPARAGLTEERRRP